MRRLLACGLLAASMIVAGSAHATGDVAVAMGDSFASGEGGRWRGNVGDVARFPLADALGPHAYWDTPTGESQPGCHRSKAAPIAMLGMPVVNLACSGATTADIPGQVAALAQVAHASRVRVVVVSIGGNDAGFGRVVSRCLMDAAVPAPLHPACRDDATVRDALSDDALAVVGAKVERALVAIHGTMAHAGYADGTWALLLQDYPRVVAAGNRYAEGWRGRLYAGGCPFRDGDVAWIDRRIPVLDRAIDGAATLAQMSTGQPIGVVHATDALAGRRLCERGAAHVDTIAGQQVRARAERVTMVRLGRPFTRQESVHPNWLGQRALGTCLALAWNGGAARSGTCHAPADWGQADRDGLPLMRFTPGR